MSEARKKLEEIEDSTDWRALVDLALADPPEPGALFYALRDWRDLFTAVFDGDPLLPDYPPAVDGFFRRIAFCTVPEPFHRFVDTFVATHDRRPLESEFPPDLAVFVETLDRPKRRPRCDTKHLRDAAKAWQDFGFLYLYEINRDLYRAIGRQPSVTFKEFDSQTLKSNTPSHLAEVKLSEKLGKTTDYIRKRLKDARTSQRRAIK